MQKVKTPFFAVRPGDVHPSTIKAGEKVDGRLAEIAEQLGALAPKQTKARKAAPENKGGA